MQGPTNNVGLGSPHSELGYPGIVHLSDQNGEGRMKGQIVSNDDGVKTHVVVLETGEEAFETLTKYVNDAGIEAASVTAIGAFERATVAFYEYEKKNYKNIPVAEASEVLSLLGDVAVDDSGKASLHLHAVLGLADGSVRGGHFVKGTVRPTLEVVVTESPACLRRKKRAELGLALIDL
jgi:predicted DNA-binding protein with PD1-like motif